MAGRPDARQVMAAYYGARAPSYDQFYRIPEFADELAWLRAWLTHQCRDRTILEVAAGTGYWTEAAARVAEAVTATDLDPRMLALARTRKLGQHVTLLAADAYALPESTDRFDTGMAHLWWSHVEAQRRQDFLRHFASRLQPGATLLLIDQVYVKGATIPASRRDRWGNRYELRRLDDGSAYEIVKNYPSTDRLRQALVTVCHEIEITRLRYFWALRAQIRPTKISAV